MLALLLLTGCLLESPVAAPTSLCAGRHLTTRRKIVPAPTCQLSKQRKSTSEKEALTWLPQRKPGVILTVQASSSPRIHDVIDPLNMKAHWLGPAQCAEEVKGSTLELFLLLIVDHIFAFLPRARWPIPDQQTAVLHQLSANRAQERA